MGVAASQMERKGISTNRGNINREIEVSNKLLRQLCARINHLKGWLKAEAKSASPPTLADVFQGILEKCELCGRYGQVRSLKMSAKIVSFLQENQITDITGLKEKVSDIYYMQGDLGGTLKVIDRRLRALYEHIRKAGYYHDHRELCRVPTDKEAEKASGVPRAALHGNRVVRSGETLS